MADASPTMLQRVMASAKNIRIQAGNFPHVGINSLKLLTVSMVHGARLHAMSLFKDAFQDRILG